MTPSALVTYTVNGNTLVPQPLPGDILNVDLSGTTGANLTKTSTHSGFQGSWTFGNRQPVNYSGMQTLVPDPTVPEPDALFLVAAGVVVLFILRHHLSIHRQMSSRACKTGKYPE